MAGGRRHRHLHRTGARFAARHAGAGSRSAAQAAGFDQQGGTSSYYRDDISELPEIGPCLRGSSTGEMAGLVPEDIQTAIIYDHFTPLVLPQLEAFGF